MYLLNPLVPCDFTLTVTFTFHYVSIKSDEPVTFKLMFGRFTFHYVSIKSLETVASLLGGNAFTFHYVSIKSSTNDSIICIGGIFTFHYVSIKSRFHWIHVQSYCNLHSTMYLLNPV